MLVRAGEDEKGWYLDYHRVDNDDAVAWHGRIRDDGTFEDVENYRGQHGFPYFPDDAAKTEAAEREILRHNERVEAILRAKGFS